MVETSNNKSNPVSTPDNLNHNIPTDKISFNNYYLIKPISINTSDDLLNNPLISKNTITPDESNQVSPTQQNNPVPATDDSSGKNKIPPNKPFIMDIPEESNQASPTQQNRPTSTTDDSSGKNKIPPNKPFIMDIPEESNQASPTQQNRPTSTTDDSSGRNKIPPNKPFIMDIPEESNQASSTKTGKPVTTPKLPTQEKISKENTTDKHIANNTPFKTENQDKASSDSTNVKKPSQGEILKSDNLNSQFNFSTVYTIGNYVYKDGELLYISPSTKDETEIGNMWITILTEIINVEEIISEHNEVLKTEEHTQWFIRIECMGRDFTVITTTQELLDYSKLLSYTADRAYCEVDSKAKRYFKKYINLLICQSNYHKEYRYKSTGWKKINNSWCYLIDTGTIGHSGYYTTYKADVPYHFEYDLEKVNSLETFMEFFNMRTLSSKKVENTIFLTHYSCLSVMTTLFQEVGHGINFVVALIGSTNSQKTATANIFTRLFNRNAKANADIRFDSTKAAILEKTASYGDAILMIDDILPYSDASLAKQQNSIVTEIIRAYGDRTP